LIIIFKKRSATFRIRKIGALKTDLEIDQRKFFLCRKLKIKRQIRKTYKEPRKIALISK